LLHIPTLSGVNFEEKRREIKAYFQFCYKRYKSLFNLVAEEEAYFQKADPLRHLLSVWEKREEI